MKSLVFVSWLCLEPNDIEKICGKNADVENTVGRRLILSEGTEKQGPHHLQAIANETCPERGDQHAGSPKSNNMALTLSRAVHLHLQLACVVDMSGCGAPHHRQSATWQLSQTWLKPTRLSRQRCSCLQRQGRTKIAKEHRRSETMS